MTCVTRAALLAFFVARRQLRVDHVIRGQDLHEELRGGSYQVVQVLGGGPVEDAAEDLVVDLGELEDAQALGYGATADLVAGMEGLLPPPGQVSQERHPIVPLQCVFGMAHPGRLVEVSAGLDNGPPR